MTTTMQMSRRRMEPRKYAETCPNVQIIDGYGAPFGDGAHVCERVNGPLISACRACVSDGLHRVQMEADKALQ